MKGLHLEKIKIKLTVPMVNTPSCTLIKDFLAFNDSYCFMGFKNQNTESLVCFSEWGGEFWGSTWLAFLQDSAASLNSIHIKNKWVSGFWICHGSLFLLLITAKNSDKNMRRKDYLRTVKVNKGRWIWGDGCVFHFFLFSCSFILRTDPSFKAVHATGS